MVVAQPMSMRMRVVMRLANQSVALFETAKFPDGH
jgi:hypothetical protein